jgi:sugar/nucleoside kinase (ribokinase family)
MKKKFHSSLLFIFSFFIFTPSTYAYNVVCVGSPCLDILLSVDEQTLRKIAPEKGGSRPVDYSTFSNIIRYSKSKPKVSLGGSAINVIRALAHLGQECAFVGKVGSDEAPTIFRDLTKLNIDALLLKSSLPTTRVCCLVTPDGQRTMRVYLGASTEALDINDIRFDCLERTSLVHLEGYLLYIKDGEFVRKVMKKAKEKKVKVSFDCASFEVVARYKEIIMNLLHDGLIDIIFANEDEVQILTNLNPIRACRELQKICEIAVATAGKKGCWVGSQGEVIHQPAFPARVVDTTGAGDFFEAGFLHGYLSGKDLATCARYGATLGKSIVEVFGTRLSSQQWQEIKKVVP